MVVCWQYLRLRVVGSSVAVRRPPRGPGAPARGPSDRDRLSARAAHPTPADGQREMQGAPGPLLLPLLVLLLALLVAGGWPAAAPATAVFCTSPVGHLTLYFHHLILS
ncbi:hypothetical protein FJT64_021672 [Amphibalanus amphitrite]|uniref:Uncharacterized protein n=1 Tax=Amphibalanus amphitrite TaxID=1232801 RepID=A0A6A4WNM6_AMPAM|nr:hypothetical protein FJT64_021672 [Amphibalanus amphitrite]